MDPETVIIDPPSWTAALELDSYFDGAKPLEVDAGSGKGRFLLARAARFPDVNFLGVERLLERVRKVDRKIRRNGLTNVRLLRIEASYALNCMLPPGSVRTVYVFFPDPWPKRRHRRRRLCNESFRNCVHRVLEPGGALHFASDQLDYCADTRALFEADARFDSIPHFEPTDDERTDFELLFTAQGAQTGRCSFVKR